MTASRRTNNFDLIRLVAALQVAVLHAIGHLNLPVSESIKEVMREFPGVPIFFTVSGFLIYQSFQRNGDDLRRYFLNRVLRIYPGLIAAFVLSLLLILLWAPSRNPRDIAIWSAGQISIFQYFTPASLRSYGVGTPNGSLWTIPVEMEFYLLVPLIYLAYRRRGIAPLILLFVASVASYMAIMARYPASSLVYKLFFVFVLPYLFNFLIGVAMAIYFDRLEPLIRGKGIYWFAAYLGINLLNSFALQLWAVENTPNVLGLINTVMLSLTVISLAYTGPSLAERLLRGNDISYGLYIYHMPVVNWAVQRGYVERYSYLLMVILITTVLALCSWTYIERPFLRLKTRPRAMASPATLEASAV